MLKIMIFVCVMCIGMVYAASSSCNSCGEECASSCGSRRFRACCFNYLRKKRVSDTDTDKVWLTQNEGTAHNPVIFLKTAEDWSDLLSSNSKLNYIEGATENRQQST